MEAEKSKISAEDIENFLKDFEVRNNLTQGLEIRKRDVIKQIVDYLNYEYKEAIILFDEKKGTFIINGTKEEQESVLKMLKESMLYD